MSGHYLLNIDDKNYAPIGIKTVDFAGVLLYILAKNAIGLKFLRVKFDAKDVNSEPLVPMKQKK